MKHFNYPAIPPECSEFIIVSPAGIGPPSQLTTQTQDSIKFLLEHFYFYSGKSTEHHKDHFSFNKDTPNLSLHNFDFLKVKHKLSKKKQLNPSLSNVRILSSNSSSTTSDLSHNTSLNSNQLSFPSVANLSLSTESPERLFLRQLQSSTTKQKTIECHKAHSELSAIISSIICFFKIHYDQGIPVYLDRPIFLDYCSSFLFQKMASYRALHRQETALKFKKSRLPRSRYPNIGLDQVRTELLSLLSFDANASVEDFNKKLFFKTKLGYSPFSIFDDVLFYFLHNSSGSSNHRSYSLNVQKIILEITGIGEINETSKNHSIESIKPNYCFFNSYLNELSDLILADDIIINQIRGIEKKDRLRHMVVYKAKAIISISFTRIVFDDSYFFHHDFLVNSKRGNDQVFNAKDRLILINSKIIQNLYPNDINLPEGFLNDQSIPKSHSIDHLCQPQNESTCGSNKTIHELMINDPDFKKMSDDLDAIQFYQNPVDISYIIWKLFKRIEKKLRQNYEKKSNASSKKAMSKSKSHELEKLMVFDDIFLYLLVVFTFNPPLNARWIAAILSKYMDLIPKNLLQSFSSFFAGVVEYLITFPSTESFSVELMNRIDKLRSSFSNLE